MDEDINSLLDKWYEAKQEIREGGADPGSFLPQGLND